MTTTAVDPPGGAGMSRPRSDLCTYTADVIAGLQTRALGERPDLETVGVLARLRRRAGRQPGSDPDLARYLLVPDRLVGSSPPDGPADAEYAVHDAITLYALHQHCQRKPMHQVGAGLGAAVSSLVSRSAAPDVIRRRFGALGSAGTYPGAVFLLRGLICGLRLHEIPIDYGLLADDLLTLRTASGARRLRAVWGHDFYRHRAARASGNTTSGSQSSEDSKT